VYGITDKLPKGIPYVYSSHYGQDLTGSDESGKCYPKVTDDPNYLHYDDPIINFK